MASDWFSGLVCVIMFDWTESLFISRRALAPVLTSENVSKPGLTLCG
jgi:hypothetical protein